LLDEAGLNYSTLAIRPFTSRPWLWPRWVRSWYYSMRDVKSLIRTHRVSAVVVTGGFVSVPVVIAAARAGSAVALVNLDAVPGKANRATARRCETIFTVYPHAPWPAGQHIGLPLRRSAVASGDAASARRRIGLDPDRPTLLVLGGSQGANSLNRMIRPLLCQVPNVARLLGAWQVFHITGSGEGQVEALERAYTDAAVAARVVPFCDLMGDAWAAASLAISRAGAGSVAEARANAVPTVFLPYPHHRDQHQKHNAEPLERAGGAIVLEDRIDPQGNASSLAPVLAPLLESAPGRDAMRRALADPGAVDGAAAVASWLRSKIETDRSDIL
jgi:UDP-N-acetylglucosamine--N-acetylmuramyl-(pentapeptide) pyrophosphoryl-undecaprenol N-acetylglucosamine transferase